MIITAKLFNAYSEVESKIVLVNLARLYGTKNINFGDVMAYFFTKYTPVSINTFLMKNKKIFSSEFGISRDRIRIISRNFVPSFGQMCSVIKNHANNERLELFGILRLYFQPSKLLTLKTIDVDDCIFEYQMPLLLAKRLHNFAEIRSGYEFLFHDAHYKDYDIRTAFSVLNNTLKQKTGLYSDEYRLLHMRMIKVYGAMFISDKHLYEKMRAKSRIPKKLAKKKKR